MRHSMIKKAVSYQLLAAISLGAATKLLVGLYKRHGQRREEIAAVIQVLTEVFAMARLNLACVAALVLVSVVAALSTSVGERRVRAGEPVVYVGAVLEYEAYDKLTEEGGEGITQENARIIAEYATEAKAQGVDILIASEYGIQSLEMPSMDNETMFTVTQYVPDPTLKAVPCDLNGDGLNFKALRTLSCAALANQIYLVVDLAEASPCSPEAAAQNPFDNALDTAYECPSNGLIYYNTQVVFDRNGTATARYRKQNLFVEPQFMPGTESDDTALFMTDFGVLFSLQVCFDIEFEHPGLFNVLNRGVKDVAMSTAWVDTFPLFSAISVQNGWSRQLGVNLLVSGYHFPERAKMGSGIYRGFSDLKHDYVYDKESGNRMIVSEVETIAAADGVIRSRNKQSTLDTLGGKGLAKDDVSVDEQPRRSHLIFYDDLSNYSHVSLPPKASGEPQVVELCHGGEICCSLTYTSTSNLNYSLLAYSGLLIINNGQFNLYIQVCSVVWCQTDDVNTCSHISDGLPPNDEFGPFTISGNFSSDPLYPTVITRNLTLIGNDLYSVTVDGNIHTLTVPQESPNIMTAGLVARWYERDLSKLSIKTFENSFYEFFISFISRLWNLF
ncbi:pantetheinase-like isoform X3 [Eriocheir sinensis]|uniref:pantetheinase-like isoform X3 n=1 Tax=Eriocheir sinensis TaxID=95602 RepID=UPI0021C64ED9|nr:pantetheinase-like isoform X3 [Eriocheir sinensis]